MDVELPTAIEKWYDNGKYRYSKTFYLKTCVPKGFTHSCLTYIENVDKKMLVRGVDKQECWKAIMRMCECWEGEGKIYFLFKDRKRKLSATEVLKLKQQETD